MRRLRAARRRAIFSFVALLALGLLTGCLRDPDPIALDEQALNVHAILEAGADSAVVVVSRPRTSTQPSFTGYQGVNDAEVRLLAGTDTTWLLHDPVRPCVSPSPYGGPASTAEGCYQADLGAPVQPGSRYRLEVALPDGTHATGETLVPPAVSLRVPDPGGRFTVSCNDTESCRSQRSSWQYTGESVVAIPVAWKQPEAVAGARVTLSSAVVHWNTLELAGDACPLGVLNAPEPDTDSTTVEVVGVHCDEDSPFGPVTFDSIRAELSVVGWNEHYARYQEARRSRGIRVDAATQGLDGAYGVFGAVAVTTRSVILVRDPPPP